MSENVLPMISSRSFMMSYLIFWDSQVTLVVKNPLANAGDVRDTGSILSSGRSPGGGHGNSLQYSYLENPMDRGAWWVAKSWTWLKWLNMHFIFKSLSHLEFLFVYGVWECYNFFDWHVAVQLSQHYLLKRLFPHCIFSPPFWRLTNHRWVGLFLGSLDCCIDSCLLC